MGKPSINKQIDETLDAKVAFGTKKHGSEGRDIIRSRCTLENYRRENRGFADWVRDRYPDRHINTLDKLRPYAEEYLTRKKPNGENYSAWTICKERAAIAKLYGEKCENILKNAPKRIRADIKRSRGHDHIPVKPIEEQPDYEALGRGAGLRRADFSRIRKEDIEKDGNRVLVHVDKGKGGKARYIVVLPDYEDRILSLAERTKQGARVIPKGSVPRHFDQHSCRRFYANTMYRLLARPIDELKREEKYFCRKDRAGIVLDRYAMKMTSRYLGHGSYSPKTGKWRDRINVIAISYLFLIPQETDGDDNEP